MIKEIDVLEGDAADELHSVLVVLLHLVQHVQPSLAYGGHDQFVGVQHG